MERPTPRPRENKLIRTDRDGNDRFDDFELYVQKCRSGKMVSNSPLLGTD